MSDEPGEAPIDTVVLDVDGTLVDTVYQHTAAWAEAFAAVGVYVPRWRIHRAIGMGGDRLVSEVAGADVERAHGDAVRAGHDERFGAVIGDVRALPGAQELIVALRRTDLRVVLASSGVPDQTKRLLDLVGGLDQLDGWSTSEDAESSKPSPDLIDVAIEQASGHRAAVVGDAVWDFVASRERGHYGIGLLTGGFGEAELRAAGADQVFSSPQDLLDHLDRTPLLRAGG
jgi:phosphoglycolate phosphatase-like HAD superfamily hydrolase